MWWSLSYYFNSSWHPKVRAVSLKKTKSPNNLTNMPHDDAKDPSQRPLCNDMPSKKNYSNGISCYSLQQRQLRKRSLFLKRTCHKY